MIEKEMKGCKPFSQWCGFQQQATYSICGTKKATMF